MPEQAACTDLGDAFKKTEKRSADRQTSKIADEATPTTQVGPMERKENRNEAGIPTSVGVALIRSKERTRLSKSINMLQQTIFNENQCM